jgi:hypothetical protein
VIIRLGKLLAKKGKPQPKQRPSLGQARQDTKKARYSAPTKIDLKN